jgi:phage shock protein E
MNISHSTDSTRGCIFYEMTWQHISGSILLGAVFTLAQVQAAEESGKTDKDVKHVNARQAEKLVEEKKVVVLDVRTPAEFKEGHIAGATNIDFRGPDFEKRVGQLDKSKTYLVHCAAGGRSTQSLPILKKEQIKSVYHLDGGFSAWKKGGLPVEK